MQTDCVLCEVRTNLLLLLRCSQLQCQAGTTANSCHWLVLILVRHRSTYLLVISGYCVTEVTKRPANKHPRPRRRNVLNARLCPCRRRCAPRQRPPSGTERQTLQVISEEAGYSQTRRRKQLIPRARLVHHRTAEEPTSRYGQCSVCLPALTQMPVTSYNLFS